MTSLARSCALAFALAALAACSKPAAPAVPPPTADFAAVARGRIDIEGGLLALGTPREGVLASVAVHEGEAVKAGQLLATLDTRPAQLAVDAAQAQLEQAKAKLALDDVKRAAAEQRADRLAAAAAYAVVRGRHGAIVGVAIATALMPPLAVMGFGLATANWTVLSGSSLLFFTNLMTIAAAAAVLARLYGFATDLSPHQSRLQLIIVAGVLAGLAIPLGIALKKIAWEALATSEIKSNVAKAFGPQARVSNLSVDFASTPLQIDATVLTPKYRRRVDQAVAHSLAGTLGEPVAVTIDQVRTADGDSAAADLVKTPTAPVHPAASRVAEELAILAGVSPDQVLVDTEHKIVEVRATPVPGADLASYRELERRIGAAEPDWTIRLVPPLLPLPSISDADTRDAALNTAIWAAQRLNLPVVLNGSGKDADDAEQALRSAGLPVQRSKTGRLSVRWQAPEASGQ